MNANANAIQRLQHSRKKIPSVRIINVGYGDRKRGKFIDDQSMGQPSKMNDLWHFMNANRVNERTYAMSLSLFFVFFVCINCVLHSKIE